MKFPATKTQAACPDCGFDLWLPIVSLSHSSVGLYSDVRFPGRSIVSLAQHYDHLDEVPPDTLLGFMADVKNCITAIKVVTGAGRVNMAILGNEVGHVHAHLIPRFWGNEPLPNKAPWEDTRVKGTLDATTEADLREGIRSALNDLLKSSKNFPREIATAQTRKVHSAPAQDVQLFSLVSSVNQGF